VKLLSKLELIKKLIGNKRFRDSYVYEHVRNSVPFQIRALREERGWTQGGLGEVAGKPRNVITRLEDPNYGRLTLKTLFEIASAFDVGLLVKFVPFSRLVREYEDVSPSALSAKSILEEAGPLKEWALAKDMGIDSDAKIRIEAIGTAPAAARVGGFTNPDFSFLAPGEEPTVFILTSLPPPKSVLETPVRVATWNQINTDRSETAQHFHID